jgi:ribosomal protein L7/L12
MARKDGANCGKYTEKPLTKDSEACPSLSIQEHALIRCPHCEEPNDPANALCEHCGAILGPIRPPGKAGITIAPELEKRVLALMQEGNKIGAIKLYREHTGVGLKDAKDAIEAIALGRPLPDPSTLDEDSNRKLVELLLAGQKIKAIKLYRERTGAGLKTAKEAVERLAADRGLPEVGGTGCLNLVLLIGATILELALVLLQSWS